MIIKYIRDAKCPFEGNDRRIKEIKNAIKTFNFNEFLNVIAVGDRVGVMECIQNNMFFEVVNDSIVEKLLQVFNDTDRKEDMLNDLDVSYRSRGTKGVFICWHSVINKYRSGQAN